MSKQSSFATRQTNFDGFLDIQIRIEVLTGLLQQHKLCAEDLHCKNQQHKKVLLELLLGSVQL